MLALIVLVGLIGGAGYYGYTWLRDVTVPDDYTGEGSGEVIVEIRPGASAAEVAQILEEQGVVKSARAFTNAIDAAGKSSSLQPGDYKMRKGMSAASAVTLLDPKLRLLAKVTIKEGLRASQIYAELEKSTGKPVKEFQEAAKNLELPAAAKGKVEGYLFPATYEITPKMTASDILQTLKDRHDEALEQAGIASRAKALGFTQHQILTIASIVQAESGSVDDMPKVARVIYNRLALNPPMKLQMDSTVMYGLNKYGIAATDAETKSDSPYNTYARHGLPPGPISNPGDHAIEAALNPAKGSWLFFVTVDPKRGITKFTDSEAEFWKLRDEFNRNYQGG
ncbi:UPF0755 protein [Thermocatellispora tengchongensis]|uniref:Endolytic murein transglycosylase n=1 Tax=Thermocatellispora tengchongensis TaxID=1073253 RepID=A0A840PR73_9ACTN|nr:endolytic transglycosylase MltG [Thermocatellispora tengchongensis]MBB5140261.1 UPF0755 protein [Thermocatellispora tengchongensis]